MGADAEHPDPGYRDVTCSFCDRHNREVHVVAGRNGLIICSVCVAACADILDGEVGLAGPQGGWSHRWPGKRVSGTPPPADA
jgi:ClpX C4-type zinc finger